MARRPTIDGLLNVVQGPASALIDLSGLYVVHLELDGRDDLDEALYDLRAAVNAGILVARGQLPLPATMDRLPTRFHSRRHLERRD